MSKNPLYTNEIATAHQFVLEHNFDGDLMSFLERMKSPHLMHSERWSEIYDYLSENYPESTGSLVTGLSYWCED